MLGGELGDVEVKASLQMTLLMDEGAGPLTREKIRWNLMERSELNVNNLLLIQKVYLLHLSCIFNLRHSLD